MINIYLYLCLAIFIHEIGHILTAIIFKVKILSIQFFLSPVLFVFIKGVYIKIGFIPLIGYINAPGVSDLSRVKRFLFYLSGIAFNLLSIAVFKDETFKIVSVILIISSVLPFKNSDIVKAFINEKGPR